MVTTDESLLTQFKEGNAPAFRALVDRYSAPIYNLAFRLLRDPMEAENITQETFLRVVQSLNRMRLDLPFKPYIFRIAVNLCRDWARKKQPLLFADLNAFANTDAGEDATETLIDDAPSPWECLEESELRAQLNTAIDKLPAHYRTVITLYYTEDFSYEDIAQALNIPVNTVRTHLRRAKQQLKQNLVNDANESAPRQAQLRSAKGEHDA